MVETNLPLKSEGRNIRRVIPENPESYSGRGLLLWPQEQRMYLRVYTAESQVDEKNTTYRARDEASYIKKIVKKDILVLV